MQVLQLIRRESSISLAKLVSIAGLAGLSNALVLAVINVAAEQAANEKASFRYLIIFLLVVALFAISQRYILIHSTDQIERMLHNIRLRLSDKIRHADLQPLERIGRAEIYASVSKETTTISQASALLVIGVQSAILMVFTILYIGLLSRTAFFLTLAFLTVALRSYFKRANRLQQEVHEALREENRIFDTLTGLLDGFKQVKMNVARSDDLLAHLRQISERARWLKTDVQTKYSAHLVFSQVMFFMLLAVMVFVVPRISPTYSDVVIKSTTAILFLIGPINTLAAAVPTLAGANAAATNIDILEEALNASVRDVPTRVEEDLSSFNEIRMEGMTFQYDDHDTNGAFRVGPFDLTIKAGELLFISGGNGSGKSTFLKLLTALYYPESGTLRVDDTIIDDWNYPSYRNLFAVIFSDYHLFQRLYGIPNPESQKINALFHEMELENKTKLVDGEFGTLDLSGGQRKRVALIVSMLEDKPIYVFDEWAADQDPHFRKKFYKELLQQMKAAGKTIIAVTHDDHYFEVADRNLKMDYGSFIEEDGPANGG